MQEEVAQEVVELGVGLEPSWQTHQPVNLSLQYFYMQPWAKVVELLNDFGCIIGEQEADEHSNEKVNYKLSGQGCKFKVDGHLIEVVVKELLVGRDLLVQDLQVVVVLLQLDLLYLDLKDSVKFGEGPEYGEDGEHNEVRDLNYLVKIVEERIDVSSNKPVALGPIEVLVRLENLCSLVKDASIVYLLL